MFRIIVVVACIYTVLGQTAHELCDQVNQLDCSKDYIPYETEEKVCGSDGVTYNNFCEYSQARCKTPTTHIAFIGDCNGPAVTTPAQAMTTGGSSSVNVTTAPSGTMTTGKPMVSGTTMATGTTPMVTATTSMATGTKPIVTGTTAMATGTTAMATGTTAMATGTTGNTGTTTIDPTLQVFCQSKDAITCPTTLDPLCGSDKNFYLNQCEFTKARCDNGGLTKEDVAFCNPGTGR